jgi:hypothetical protein
MTPQEILLLKKLLKKYDKTLPILHKLRWTIETILTHLDQELDNYYKERTQKIWKQKKDTK